MPFATRSHFASLIHPPTHTHPHNIHPDNDAKFETARIVRATTTARVLISPSTITCKCIKWLPVLGRAAHADGHVPFTLFLPHGHKRKSTDVLSVVPSVPTILVKTTIVQQHRTTVERCTWAAPIKLTHHGIQRNLKVIRCVCVRALEDGRRTEKVLVLRRNVACPPLVFSVHSKTF